MPHCINDHVFRDRNTKHENHALYWLLYAGPGGEPGATFLGAKQDPASSRSPSVRRGAVRTVDRSRRDTMLRDDGVHRTLRTWGPTRCGHHKSHSKSPLASTGRCARGTPHGLKADFQEENR
ncbi:hypothetical protein B296_00036780 [Ensete ventricosum]|uniref:Uncharacterized protein n=1 Tax=Ensete ventricosum TaxID=4639 RepID=A0A426YEF1_ENSVE|nr:hypothetical protein B296_00036780 [Ensete ventricosum]